MNRGFRFFPDRYRISFVMSAMRGNPWTREELILAINLYCRTPFGRIHMRNPEIVLLAEKLGRTPGAVSLKLANFAGIDPSLDRKGASHASNLDRQVWEEFFRNWEGMALESEGKWKELQEPQDQPEEKEEFLLKEGKTREATIQARIGQDFFRKTVLSSYENRCCITGIADPDLLVASHIVPWKDDVANCLNPMNGLCLNALHDRAFDKGLITLDEAYRVLVSKSARHELLTQYGFQPINLPRRFIPEQKFLEFHRRSVFQP